MCTDSRDKSVYFLTAFIRGLKNTDYSEHLIMDHFQRAKLSLSFIKVPDTASYFS